MPLPYSSVLSKLPHKLKFEIQVNYYEKENFCPGFF